MKSLIRGNEKSKCGVPEVLFEFGGGTPGCTGSVPVNVNFYNLRFLCCKIYILKSIVTRLIAYNDTQIGYYICNQTLILSSEYR